MPGHFVRRLQQVAVSLFMEELAAHDITPVQYGALVAVSEQPEMDQATLAALIGYDRATIGGVVDRLETKGWVRRAADERDRRVRRVTITTAGQKVLREATPAVKRVQARLVEPLSDAEQKAFESLCRKILSHHVA